MWWRADMWPCEDFVIGSVTSAFLVVSAWTAGEDLQLSGKELTPSLLKSEHIEDTKEFIKYSMHLLRFLLSINIASENTCKLLI